jgi:hypothetical protein
MVDKISGKSSTNVKAIFSPKRCGETFKATEELKDHYNTTH